MRCASVLPFRRQVTHPPDWWRKHDHWRALDHLQQDSDADRAFLRDVLGLPNVDVGGGWLIFGLPPAEVAVHPSEKNDVHEFYLMCDDVEALIADMTARGVGCGPVHDEGWGVLTHVILPGGGKLGIYQPRHARPEAMTIGKSG